MRSIFYVELWMAQNKMSSFISIALIICVRFCISARNKPALLMAGVLETVLLLLSSDTMAVVFKLLGVLRMLVDGQGEKRSTQCSIFLDENIVMQRKHACQLSKISWKWRGASYHMLGRGRGCGYLVLYYQSLALTFLKIGVSDSWLL